VLRDQTLAHARQRVLDDIARPDAPIAAAPTPLTKQLRSVVLSRNADGKPAVDAPAAAAVAGGAATSSSGAAAAPAARVKAMLATAMAKRSLRVDVDNTLICIVSV
jgi:hypothetical protein